MVAHEALTPFLSASGRSDPCLACATQRLRSFHDHAPVVVPQLHGLCLQLTSRNMVKFIAHRFVSFQRCVSVLFAIYSPSIVNMGDKLYSRERIFSQNCSWFARQLASLSPTGSPRSTSVRERTPHLPHHRSHETRAHSPHAGWPAAAL